MFDRVMIANRGAIAVRIARTLRRMGIHSVGVYAESDRDSLHLSAVDQACPLGGGGASDTYINEDKLFETIERTGAEAVHPGYGFLSENAGFAERLAERGVVFIGPRPEHIRRFGLKHEARAIAGRAGCQSHAGQRASAKRGGSVARGGRHRLSGDAEEHGGRRGYRHAPY